MERQIRIIKNAARCKMCGEIIESKTVHDFRPCKCFIKSDGAKGLAVDGGKEYLRRVGDPSVYEDLSETRPFTDEEQAEYEAKIQKQKEYLFWGYDD